MSRHDAKNRSALRPGLTVALAASLAVSCDHSPVGLDAFNPAACELPPVAVASGVLAGLEASDFRAAVQDAERRLAASLPPGRARDELISVLAHLSTQIGGPGHDTGCRLVHLALEVLEPFEDVPALRPDLDALRLVIGITTAALAQGAD